MVLVLWLTADSVGEARGAEADEGRDGVIGNAQSKVKVGHIARTQPGSALLCSAHLGAERRRKWKGNLAAEEIEKRDSAVWHMTLTLRTAAACSAAISASLVWKFGRFPIT